MDLRNTVLGDERPKLNKLLLIFKRKIIGIFKTFFECMKIVGQAKIILRICFANANEQLKKVIFWDTLMLIINI